MKQQQMFCSGCDRNVRVLVTDAVEEEPQANVRDQELVCLEIGDWCSGNLCPLGAAAPSAMVSRLIHSGISLDNLQTVRGHCEACGIDNDLALYGKDMAACMVCGTSRERPLVI
jgi:hypothetical protein